MISLSHQTVIMWKLYDTYLGVCTFIFLGFISFLLDFHASPVLPHAKMHHNLLLCTELHVLVNLALIGCFLLSHVYRYPWEADPALIDLFPLYLSRLNMNFIFKTRLISVDANLAIEMRWNSVGKVDAWTFPFPHQLATS